MENKLVEGDPENCISCFELTPTKISCCKASICKECYLKWLKRKRQCMHCKADQFDFQVWMDNYREEDNEEDDEFSIDIVEITLENTSSFLSELTEYTLLNLSNQSIGDLIDTVRRYNELFQLYINIRNSDN